MKINKLIIILIVILNLHVLGTPNTHSDSFDELENYIQWQMEKEANIRASRKLAKYMYSRIIYWQKIKGIK